MIYLFTVPNDDTGLGTAAIVVTIVASVFFAVLLMALVAWYCSRLREESRLKSLAEDTYKKSSKYYAYPGTYNTNYRSGTHPCLFNCIYGIFFAQNRDARAGVDTGFSVGGGANIQICQIFPNLHEIKKILVCRGARAGGAPPWIRHWRGRRKFYAKTFN